MVLKYLKVMRNLLLGFFVVLSFSFVAQHTQGRIVIERRSNLEKLFKGSKFGKRMFNNQFLGRMEVYSSSRPIFSQ